MKRTQFRTFNNCYFENTFWQFSCVIVNHLLQMIISVPLWCNNNKKKSAAWKCHFSQRHSNKEGIKRTSVPCANKTLICTASTLQTLSAILLPGTRVGVRGVTLEHFQPLLTELSLSPSHGAACTADHWLGHGVSETRLKIVLFCFLTQCILTWVTRRQKDTAALLPDHNFLTCSGRQ